MWVNLVILKQLPLQSEADISEKHASPAKQSVFVSHILSHVFFTPSSEVPQKLCDGSKMPFPDYRIAVGKNSNVRRKFSRKNMKST